MSSMLPSMGLGCGILMRVVWVAFGLVSVMTPARATDGFTLEQVRNYPFHASLVTAENRDVAAWLVNHQGRRNVWVADGKGFEPRQLTSYLEDDGQEITSLSLSADGKYAVYVRGGDHIGNWDRHLPANPTSSPLPTSVEVWSVRVSGGVPNRLGEGDYPVVSPDGDRVVFLKDDALWVAPIAGGEAARRLFTARGRLNSPAWSPDGKRLAFVSVRDGYSLIGVYQDDETPILWIAPAPARDGSPRWSVDGRHIAYVRRAGRGGAPGPRLQFEPEPWSIWVADAQTGTAVQRWRSGSSLRDSYPGESYLEWADGGRLVFRSYQDGWQHLYSLPASPGEPMQLTSGAYMVEDVALSPDRRHLVFNANHGDATDDMDRRHLFKVSVDRADVSSLVGGDGLEWAPAYTGEGRLLFFSATAQRPAVLATLATPGETQGSSPVRLLTSHLIPVDFPTEQLILPRRVEFQAADGVTVHGQLFEPKVRGNAPRPAIVYVHGGPQRQMLLGWNPRASYTNYYALNQYLASQGYVVLSVNFRLGPGYGHDFHFPARAGVRGAAEYQDIQAAAHYLQKRSDVDSRRIGIYGGSYGGYLTGLALARDSETFSAGVNIHGVHDWTLVYLRDLYGRAQYEMAPDREQAIDVGWQSSPMSAVSTWKSPVLFIHGDDDRNIELAQTVDLVRRLDLQGVQNETIVLVDETHAILRHANAVRLNRATADFFDRHLKGVAP